MAAVELAPEGGDDFYRVLDHLLENYAADAIGRIDEIIDALSILETSPIIRDGPHRLDRDL